MKIAVVGATGRVGRHVVDILRARQHDVIAISRSNGVNVITGEGLGKALTGVESVVDAASGPSPEQAAATEFFTTEAHNLQTAARQAKVKRIVVISIIGIDRFTGGYMAAKVAHENVMLAGSIPVRILRAAQFHEFVEQIVGWGRQGEVSYVPKMRTQLVAAHSVAQKLADFALDVHPAQPGMPILEVAGPLAENLIDAATRFAARSGDPVRIEASSNPDDPDQGLYESGALLPGPHATLAGPTFEEWLTSTYQLAAAR